ncbi:MAG: hypothetical protein V1918_01120 [Planctomycetota bacterium]
MGVRFSRIDLYEVRIPFRLAYAHALAERREASSLLCRVATDSGRAGWGEIVPRAYLTGETLASAREDILTRWWPCARGLEIQKYTDLLPALAELYAEADHDRRTASYAGVELACIDAAGSAFGLPARMLAAVDPEPAGEGPSLFFTRAPSGEAAFRAPSGLRGSSAFCDSGT